MTGQLGSTLSLDRIWEPCGERRWDRFRPTDAKQHSGNRRKWPKKLTEWFAALAEGTSAHPKGIRVKIAARSSASCAPSEV